MRGPARVKVPWLWDFGTKFWVSVLVIATAGICTYVGFRQPEHRLGAAVALPFVLLLAGSALPTVWIEPSTGTLIVRQVIAMRSRYLLRGSSVTLVPSSEALALHVRPAGTRYGANILLLRGNEHDLVSQPSDLLRTLARTLHQHCPTVAPDTVTLLTAQADHLDTGRPVLESPLAAHLLHATTDRPRPRRPR